MATQQMPGSLTLQQKQYDDFSVKRDQVTLRRPENSKHMTLTVNGHTHTISRIASAFPLSSAMKDIAFFDEEGEEIGMMREGISLDEESKRILREELEKSYFMPGIESIESMEENLGVASWTVQTDKGERTFEVRDPRRNVRKIGNGRVIVKDVDGNRYEIPNWYRLDRKSLALLMRHL
jgi:hypothetical protein